MIVGASNDIGVPPTQLATTYGSFPAPKRRVEIGNAGHNSFTDLCVITRSGGGLVGYGYLQLEGETWSNGFMAVTRAARGRGVAGALKRAQLRWAKEQGIATLRTATEVRLTSMLDLNCRFGYVPLYEEIVLRGPLAAD